MMVNPILEGERPGAFSPPPHPPDTYRLISWFEKEINLHLMLPLLEGNVADYTAGYPLNLRSHAMRARYNAIAENYTAGWVQLGKLILKCVVALGHPVSVFLPSTGEAHEGTGEYLEMTPEMASRSYHIHVHWPLQIKSEEALPSKTLNRG